MIPQTVAAVAAESGEAVPAAELAAGLTYFSEFGAGQAWANAHLPHGTEYLVVPLGPDGSQGECIGLVEPRAAAQALAVWRGIVVDPESKTLYHSQSDTDIAADLADPTGDLQTLLAVIGTPIVQTRFMGDKTSLAIRTLVANRLREPDKSTEFFLLPGETVQNTHLNEDSLQLHQFGGIWVFYADEHHGGYIHPLHHFLEERMGAKFSFPKYRGQPVVVDGPHDVRELLKTNRNELSLVERQIGRRITVAEHRNRR